MLFILSEQCCSRFRMVNFTVKVFLFAIPTLVLQLADYVLIQPARGLTDQFTSSQLTLFFPQAISPC